MAPTYDLLDQISRDWRRLTPLQKEQFKVARDEMIADMRAGKGFRKSLRVKGVQGHPNVFEMTWAPDGRATFSYGEEVLPGEPHIIWRRIGTHTIFARP